jgi:hypothetical protein
VAEQTVSSGPAFGLLVLIAAAIVAFRLRRRLMLI